MLWNVFPPSVPAAKREELGLTLPVTSFSCKAPIDRITYAEVAEAPVVTFLLSKLVGNAVLLCGHL